MAQGSTLTRLGAGSATAAAVYLRKPDDSVNLGDSTNPVRVDTTGSTTQPVSAASLPLPSGAATAAKQDTGNTSLASIDGKITAVNTGAVVLAAGTAAFGKLSANSGVDIGDVDVTSIVPGTSATNLGKAADAVAGATDTGVSPLFIRDDALSAITPAEGDYAPGRVDANGAQWVIHSGNLTVNAHAVTNAGTFAVQVDGAALTSLQLIDDTVHAANAALSKTIAIGGQLDDASTTAATEDNVSAVRVTAQRAFHMNIRNVAGTEMGTSSNPLQVTLANTGANSTPVANNMTQINGVTLLAGNGATGTGSIRVTIANDNTAIPVATHAVTVASGGIASGAIASGAIAAGAIATGATSIAANEDDASANLDTGVKILAIQKSTPADTAGTDGDYAMPQMSAGRVWVSANIDKLAGTATDTNSGSKSAGTLRVVLATDQPALTNKLLVTPDSVALPANQSVNISQINGVTPLMGTGVMGTGSPRVTIASDNDALTVKQGTAANLKVEATIASAQTLATVTTVSTVTSLTGGGVAHDGADSGNPLKVGGRAVSAEIAAVSNNDRVDFVTDLVGKHIVLPYANPENFVSGAITSAMTGTTSTSLIAAPAAGLRNYITQITVSNSHATVGTDIAIQDGSGGTTLYTIPAASVYGGAVLTFPTPLRQPTTATAIYCANVTTGASTKVSASGYKGA